MDEQMKTGETGDKNAVIDQKLRQFFDGKIVRKDLTKKIKEGANVPVYVLEFLLGQYCSSDDPEVIETGVENVKRILADNYVRPDEAQKILSMLRQRGMHTVIDKITVNLNMKKDTYEAEFSNLGIKNIPISEDYPAKFDRLLCGGIWCIVQLEYVAEDDDFEFTGKKLQAYILYGVRYTVNTWKDMLIQVCNHILLKRRSTIEWLCANEKSGFSTTPESWRRELGPNMYLWTDNSTQTKINILHGLFEECNIPSSELIFEFRSDTYDEDEE